MESNKVIFFNKGSTFGEVTLVESGNIVKDQHEVAEIFNNFFGNIVENLQLPLSPSDTVCKIHKENFIQESISKYRNHPSTVKIKESTTTEHFSFVIQLKKR